MNGMRAIVKNMGLVILFIVSLLLSVSCDDEDITRSPQVGSVDFQFELYDAEGNPYIVDALPSGTFHLCCKRPDMIATSWINNEVMIVSENMIGHLSYWWFVNGESSSDEPFTVKLGLMSDLLFNESGIKYMDVQIGKNVKTADDRRDYKFVSWQSDGLDVMYVRDKKLSPQYIITCIGVRLPL